jgi:hypothetical protein
MISSTEATDFQDTTLDVVVLFPIIDGSDAGVPEQRASLASEPWSARRNGAIQIDSIVARPLCQDCIQGISVHAYSRR